MTGAANNGGEHSPRGIIPGKASLYQAGAVVAHKCGGLILITHGVGFLRMEEKTRKVTGGPRKLCKTETAERFSTSINSIVFPTGGKDRVK